MELTLTAFFLIKYLEVETDTTPTRVVVRNMHSVIVWQFSKSRLM